MKFKKFFKKTDLTITILITIGILIVVNFFSYQIFYRWDLTQNKDFSISKVSKNSAKNLDDVVSIKVYFSENLPTQYINLKQEVGDILDEYANYSSGNVKVEFINPDDLEEMELYVLGIPALQFNVLEKDKYEVVKGYLGMTIQYGDDTEVLSVVDSTENLEYQVTMAIKKLTNENMAEIGLVSVASTLDTGSEISTAYAKLQEIYNITDVDLSEEISSNIGTLLIIGPREAFSEEQLKVIDQFSARGGSLLVLVDGVMVGEGLSATANETALNSILNGYGVELNNDLVLDTSSGVASFNSGFFTFSTNYPLWPKVIHDGFDENNTAVSQLESLILPWASSIDVLTDNQDGINISTLVKTTNRAWLQDGDYDLNPQQSFDPSKAKNQYNLAVLVEGKFESAYEQGSSDNSKLILVGDSDFISDSFASQSSDNLIFFQNLVDSLSLDDDLISIRSKSISERPIKEISEGQKMAIRYLNVFGLTVVVVVFGIGRYFLRRRKDFIEE